MRAEGALAASLAVALLACRDEPCAEYAALPEARGLCLARRVDAAPDAAAALAVCQGEAREVEALCRQRWVEARLMDRHTAADDLLRVCGAHQECVFEVLDARPTGTVAEQVLRCETAVPLYARDCAGHAVERWATAGPPEAEIVALRRGLDRYPDLWSSYVGIALVCGGHPGCDAVAIERHACEQSLAKARALATPCRTRPSIDRPLGGPPG